MFVKLCLQYVCLGCVKIESKVCNKSMHGFLVPQDLEALDGGGKTSDKIHFTDVFKQ